MVGRVTVSFSIFCLFVWSQGMAGVPPFEVHGFGETRGKMLTGGGINWRFSLWVSNCCWSIRVVPLGLADSVAIQSSQPPPLLPVYSEASYDGSQYYLVESFDPRTPLADRKIRNDGFARVASHFDPVLHSRELKVLWYLYASRCVLASRTNVELPRIEPVAWDEYRDGKILEKARLKPLVGGFGLPELVQFGSKIEDIRGVSVASNSVSQILKGEELKVVSVTNLASVVLPYRSKLECFFSLASDNPWVLVEIQAESATSEIPSRSFIPVLPERSLVSDARFWASNTPGSPSVVTNIWPTYSESRERYFRKLQSLAHAETAKTKRLWWLVIFAMLNAVAIIVLVKIKKHKN
jgi:hypothetical protein